MNEIVQKGGKFWAAGYHGYGAPEGFQGLPRVPWAAFFERDLDFRTRRLEHRPKPMAPQGGPGSRRRIFRRPRNELYDSHL